MRENIAESLRLREETDTELALGLVSKEASMNRLTRVSPSKPMNVHGNTVSKAFIFSRGVKFLTIKY